MYVEAALIGVGAYILFKDLPETIRTKSIKHSWIPHLAVFAGLFLMHGGSAEGTVIAGIATVIFRWLMHRASPKDDTPSSKSPLFEFKLATPEERSRVEAQADAESLQEMGFMLIFGVVLFAIIAIQNT